MFGEPRLFEIVRSQHGCSAQKMQELIISELDRTTGGAPLVDDVALVVVGRK